MSWIDEHKKYWRVALLVLLLPAFIGPWGFDHLNIPEEYTEDACLSPIIRLEGDFCGYPVPGTAMIAHWASWPIYLVTGGIDLTYGIQFLFFNSIYCLIPLPFIATLLLIRGRESRLRWVSRVVAWSLAAGASLLLVTFHAMRIGGFSWNTFLPPKIWGTWLYIGLAAIALALEILSWKGNAVLARGPES